MQTHRPINFLARLGVADAALNGQPTVIARGGKFVILRALKSSEGTGEFDSLIEAGKRSRHRKLTPRVFSQIWKRGRALSGKRQPQALRNST